MAALLAGCGVLPLSSSKGQDDVQPPVASHGAIARSPASMSGKALLYLAGSPSLPSGTVYVYTYPQGHLVETLTGFAQPFGECSDSAGDVFVVRRPMVPVSAVGWKAHDGHLESHGRQTRCFNSALSIGD
jgi:hypothetical protein